MKSHRAVFVITRFWSWFTVDFFGIFQEMRWSYLPPLMVYLAAGVAGFTGIIESFFIKEKLGLSAAFLAGLAFWAGLPWALKMPLGHLVDLFWRRKYLFVYLGASIMAISLLIMVGLTGYTDRMGGFLKLETWYVIAALLSPVGFVLQDVVADAMTVEAVPDIDEDGSPIPEVHVQRMHVTVQTLGRIAIIAGSALVAGLGGWLAKTLSYVVMYWISLIIPLISVMGVVLANLTQRRRGLGNRPANLAGAGSPPKAEESVLALQPNWAILGGSSLFVVIALIFGISDLTFKKEFILFGSLGVIIYLMKKILGTLSSTKQREIIGIAVIVFVFRAMPTFGAGASWWEIDVLKFDEAFFGTLRQISSILVILGLFGLRAWMARRPLPYLVVFLSIYSALMMLPFIGMFHGLHEWTLATFGFGARTIAIIDTMADSPLGQVAMVPMLAWIAREAPKDQKATYFAVMAAFTNLALSASNLATEYINKIFVIERGQYDELGMLMISVTVISLVLPTFTVLICNRIFQLSNRKYEIIA
jgi:MFS family permease